MPKDHFQFKQFSISQTGTTLKVCTDSCLFGAWLSDFSSESKKALDIGTGTGLLALMYAQTHPEASILALEIDSQSAELSTFNFSNSPWNENLSVQNTSIQDFVDRNRGEKFDEIFCNPPFFENQLFSSDNKKNLAKHSSQLSRQELAEAIVELLEKNGSAYILLPDFEASDFVAIARQNGLFLVNQKTVRNKTNGPVFRQMMQFQKHEKDCEMSEIVIYESDKVYTAEFIELLKPYYLYL